jgi:hypothetical protein
MNTFAKTAIAIVAVFPRRPPAWGNRLRRRQAIRSSRFSRSSGSWRAGATDGRIKDEIQDKSWQEAQVSAWILAEMANVNQYQKPDAEFQALALKMSGQCVELAKILKRRDQKAAIDQAQSVGQTCKSCHEKYRKNRGGKGKKGEGD